VNEATQPPYSTKGGRLCYYYPKVKPLKNYTPIPLTESVRKVKRKVEQPPSEKIKK
jgi:hypothetical protein